MCLSKINFNTTYEDGYFIGTGYKAYSKSELPQMKRWLSAKGHLSKSKYLPNAEEYSNDGEKYVPGFHIFLDKVAAKNYFRYSIPDIIVVKVSFYEIICYGTNTAYNNYKKYPTIVARYMRIDEICV